jgi:hypothetical protein
MMDSCVTVGKDMESGMLLLSRYGFETEPASLEVKLDTRIIKGTESTGNANIERSYD